MKKMHIVVAVVLLVLLASCGKTADGSVVYVCTGPTATTYHATPNCRGLSRCSGDVVYVQEDEAVDELRRRPCKICNY